MRAYTRGDRCLMELLQESLDDPHAEPCGRCSVCRGGLPEELAGEPSVETVQAVTRLLRGQVHLLEPRKMWPGGAFGSRGRISPEDTHEVGRTLIHADAPEWRETVAQVFGRDAPAPGELGEACVRLLAGWKEELRRGAAIALGECDHPSAKAALQKHVRTLNKTLRRACEVSLEAIRKRAAIASNERVEAMPDRSWGEDEPTTTWEIHHE